MSTDKLTEQPDSFWKDLLTKKYLEILLGNLEKKLEKRIEKKISARIDSIMKGGENEQKLFVGVAIQDQILNSRLFKLFFWLLIGVIAIGIMIWIGGIAYGAVQIESLKTRTEEIQAQIGKSEDVINQMESDYRIYVSKAGDDAINNIQSDATQAVEARKAAETQIADSLKKVSDTSNKAIESIKNEEAMAIVSIRVTRKEKEDTILQTDDPRGYYRIEIGATWFYVLLALLVLSSVFSSIALILTIRNIKRKAGF